MLKRRNEREYYWRSIKTYINGKLVMNYHDFEINYFVQCIYKILKSYLSYTDESCFLWWWLGNSHEIVFTSPDRFISFFLERFSIWNANNFSKKLRVIHVENSVLTVFSIFKFNMSKSFWLLRYMIYWYIYTFYVSEWNKCSFQWFFVYNWC